jgi:hypothetical protein
LPAQVVRLVSNHPRVDGTAGIAAVIVIAQLILGAWLARRGGRLAVAYTGLVLMLSSLSSLLMHAVDSHCRDYLGGPM